MTTEQDNDTRAEGTGGGSREIQSQSKREIKMSNAIYMYIFVLHK